MSTLLHPEKLYILPKITMKSFDLRNALKKKIHDQDNNLYAWEKEMRFAHLGCNIGNEQDGRWKDFLRPVAILKRMGNVFRVAPMTTNGKDGKYFYTLPEHYFTWTSRIILSQVRIIDRKRLTQKLGDLHPADFIRIQERLKTLLF